MTPESPLQIGYEIENLLVLTLLMLNKTQRELLTTTLTQIFILYFGIIIFITYFMDGISISHLFTYFIRNIGVPDIQKKWSD